MAANQKPAEKKTAPKTKDETPRARFERVGGTRVANAINKIDLIGNICDPRRYDYTAADIELAFTTLRERLSVAENRMKEGLNKKEKGGKEKASFKFGE